MSDGIKMDHKKGAGRPTFVYAIQTKCSVGFVKIGISSDVNRRIAHLQTSNPYALEVTRVWGPFSIAYARRLEQRLHMAFEEKAARGEWFGVTPDEVSNSVRTLADMQDREFSIWMLTRRFEGAPE